MFKILYINVKISLNQRGTWFLENRNNNIPVPMFQFKFLTLNSVPRAWKSLAFLWLLCTIIMNNLKLKRARENQNTNLCGSAMCLRPQECDYIIFNDHLGLQHNIFIYNKILLYGQIWKTSKYWSVLSYYSICSREYEPLVLTLFTVAKKTPTRLDQGNIFREKPWVSLYIFYLVFYMATSIHEAQARRLPANYIYIYISEWQDINVRVVVSSYIFFFVLFNLYIWSEYFWLAFVTL
jgi:hypothetical protein